MKLEKKKKELRTKLTEKKTIDIEISGWSCIIYKTGSKI